MRCPRCDSRLLISGVLLTWVCGCTDPPCLMISYEDFTDCGDYRLRVVLS